MPVDNRQPPSKLSGRWIHEENGIVRNDAVPTLSLGSARGRQEGLSPPVPGRALQSRELILGCEETLVELVRVLDAR